MSSPYIPSPGHAAPRPRVRRGPYVWSWSKVLPIGVRALIAILVLDAAQFVFGTYFHDIPGIELAAGFVSLAPAWFVVGPLVLVVAAWLAWRRWPGRFGTTVVVVGVLTAAAAGVITGRMIQSVQKAGVDIDAAPLFQLKKPNLGAPDDRPVYLKRGDESLNLDVYRSAKANAPVLLFIHGGGWAKGNPSDRSTDLRWFADQGFLVMSVEYSLSSSTKHFWDVTQSQIGCSLSWIAAHASDFGGDASRLSIVGASAGGNLAINTAYLQAAGKLPSACGGKPATVGAVSVTYPAVDPASAYDGSRDGAEYARDYIGGSPKRFPERYEAVSSDNKITADAPPTLILGGKSDRLVPPESVVSFADRAREAGVETKLVQVPFADHGFDALIGNIGNQAFRQLTVKWLSQHGLAP